MNHDSGHGYHRPVMVDEVMELLRPIERGVVVDATFGGGGHADRLRDEFGGRPVELVAIDRDPDAAEQAGRLGFRFLAGNFADLSGLLSEIGPLTGILFDFGISSHQVDEPARGFSYRLDGPLDMRMDPNQPETAADLVNRLPVAELTRIIARQGEEPHAGRIARAIVAARPLGRTIELAEVVAGAVPAAARRRSHPARRTFQALRITVNHELDAITQGLEAALGMLEPGGRCVAISYHSLEDRIVKRRFIAGATGCICPPGLPVCGCNATAELRLLTRQPVRPGPFEVAANPRSRSARLRAAEKVAA